MKILKSFNSHPLLQDRVRLSLIAALASSPDPIEFNVLLDSLKLTKGNLSSHLRKLEEAGLIEVNKIFENRKPKTSYACSVSGRTELEGYLRELEKLILNLKTEVA